MKSSGGLKMKLAMGSLTTIVGRLIELVIGLAVSTIIARSLQTHDFGQYSYFVWLTWWLTVASTCGLSPTITSHIATSKGKADHDALAIGLAWSLFAVFATAFVLICALFIFKSKLPAAFSESGIIWLPVALSIAFLGRSLGVVGNSIAKGYNKFTLERISNTSTGLINLAFVGLAAAYLPSVKGFVLAYAASSAIVAMSIFSLLRRHDIKASFDNAREWIRGKSLWPEWFAATVINGIAKLGTQAISPFMLSIYANTSAFGIFTLTVTLSRLCAGILSEGILSVILSGISRIHGERGKDGARDACIEAFRYTTLVAAFTAGVAIICASAGIQLLYGSKYAEAKSLVQILAVGLCIGSMAAPFWALMTTFRSRRARLKLTFLELACCATGAWLLIPRFGITGAVIVEAVLPSIMLLACAFALRSVISLRIFAASIGRVLAAVLVALLPWLLGIRFFSVDSIVWAALASTFFAVIFVAMSAMLGVIRRRDINLMRTMTGSLPLPGAVARAMRSLLGVADKLTRS